MKRTRLLAFLSALTLLMAGACPALADYALTPCELPEFGMTVPLPADFLLLRRDLPDDDPAYAYLGIDAATSRAYMEQGDLYLDAVAKDASCEVFVTVTEDEALSVDFHSVGDNALIHLGAAMAEQYASQGITVTQTEVYRADGVTFLLLWQTVGGREGLQCYTIRPGYAISVTFGSAGLMTDDDAALMYEIMDGVRFN